VHDSITPDVWLDSKQVWEVKCADLSISPVHLGGVGKVSKAKGIGLRFPRFLRLREDKACEQATSAQQVADMYLNQDNIATETCADDDDDGFI
jgi:DNA ligase-1